MEERIEADQNEKIKCLWGDSLKIEKQNNVDGHYALFFLTSILLSKLPSLQCHEVDFLAGYPLSTPLISKFDQQRISTLSVKMSR
jgi:hypothetical protein